MKSVFITGATTNTGLGIAHKFAKEGYAVFIAAVAVSRQPKLQKCLRKNMVYFQKAMI